MLFFFPITFSFYSVFVLRIHISPFSQLCIYIYIPPPYLYFSSLQFSLLTQDCVPLSKIFIIPKLFKLLREQLSLSNVLLFKKCLHIGTWVAQLVKCLTSTSAQVMISWYIGQSSASGSTLGFLVIPAWDSVFPLSAPPHPPLMPFLSLKCKYT